MNATMEQLAFHLIARYQIFSAEAYSMIYNEWEYVEEILAAEGGREEVLDYLARTLLDIYMVA